MFYNSWLASDALIGALTPKDKILRDFLQMLEDEPNHFSLVELCAVLESKIKRNWGHVKLYCDQNNYLILELLEDKEFSLKKILFNHEALGFKQKIYTAKGKYYSTKPLNVYKTSLLLNLVDKQNTFYNNKYSDIFCEFPVEDGEQTKFQTYEPPNCTKNVYKCTNHLKFEITDENGKVINFRGKPVKIHLSFEVFPFNK